MFTWALKKNYFCLNLITDSVYLLWDYTGSQLSKIWFSFFFSSWQKLNLYRVSKKIECNTSIIKKDIKLCNGHRDIFWKFKFFFNKFKDKNFRWKMNYFFQNSTIFIFFKKLSQWPLPTTLFYKRFKSFSVSTGCCPSNTDISDTMGPPNLTFFFFLSTCSNKKLQDICKFFTAENVCNPLHKLHKCWKRMLWCT